MTFYFWIIQSALAQYLPGDVGKPPPPKFWDTDFGEFLIALFICLFLMWLIPKFWRRFGKSLFQWMKRETKSTFGFWFGWLKAPEEEDE